MNEKPPTSNDNEIASVTDLRNHQEIQADNFKAQREELVAQGYNPEGNNRGVISRACKRVLNSFNSLLNEKDMSDSQKMQVWQQIRREALVVVKRIAASEPGMGIDLIAEGASSELELRFNVLCAEAMSNDDSTVVSLNAFRNKKKRL